LISHLYINFRLFYFILICRSRVNLISTTDCATEEQKRWPEDIAWHPDGKSLFSVYSADSQDSQVSVTEFKEGERVRILRLVMQVLFYRF
jgi:hypothetical protein